MKKLIVVILAFVLIASVVFAANILISPLNPTDSDSLVCSVEGGSASYNFYWYKDSIKYKQSTGSSSTLEASSTSCSDEWMCIVFMPQSDLLPETYIGESTVNIACQSCGDGIVNNNEACEFPNTNNNNYCPQSQTSCNDRKQGTRDSFGDCNSACGCTYDSYSYACVKGACNAECAVNADCNDGNQYTTDYCDAGCVCHHDTNTYCGDGTVNNNEVCELPNTQNNNKCSQSVTQCSAKKQGTRDAYGNCDSACGCVYDSFSYQCVKGQCTAECAVNADCNDQNPNTNDYCDSGCVCHHDSVAFCGDNIVNNNEQCELPSSSNNHLCSQTASQCSGKKYGSRDTYGNCDSACACTYDSFLYACVKNTCGAECAVNVDCNDGNQYTTDYCDSGCVCHHDPVAYCGDSIVNNNEQCELPSTQNNNLCSQSTSTCSGTKKGTRDSYGNCNSACACTYDSYSYQCVKGACGAQCAVNADCNDGNQYTTDTCDSGCLCHNDPVPYCGDGIVNNNEVCELPNTQNNNKCSQTCTQCSGKKQGTRDSYGNCDANCGCVYDPFVYQCIKGQCGAECAVNADCNDGNVHTTDSCLDTCVCQHTPIPYCGDNIVNNNEQCELPSTQNNNKCSQTTTQCSGTKQGTRDSYGNCDTYCGCINDAFTYQCVKWQCGATCAINADCNDQNSNTNDYCDAGCACHHDIVAYCGDNIVNLNEQCELPSTQNNNKCAQSATSCSGKKLGTRDSAGNCNATCGCIYDSFANYQCVIGQCGAQCVVDADCADSFSYTLDYCDSGCVCHHDVQPYCGDSITNGNEQCEMPNTLDDTECVQVSQQCVGTKLGIRDKYGNCDSICGCVQDNFTLVCVKGQCGAQCDSNLDCNDQNQFTVDTCLSNCSCSHTLVPQCGDGVINNNETCELPNSQNNNYCPQCLTSCQGKKQGTRDAFGNCNSVCGCVLDSFSNFQCVKSACGAACAVDADCNDQNANTNDYCDSGCACHHDMTAFCGDNIVNLNEQCEMPSTQNNIYCTQSTTVCSAKRTGTRDSYGNCNNQCGCVQDLFSFQCITGSCGAQCDSNDDCLDSDPLTFDYCELDCMCRHDLDPEFNYSLSKGWNLISIPMTIENTTLPGVFSAVDFKSIFAHQGNIWYTYSKGAPAYLNTLQKVDPSMGLWVEMNNDALLSIHGFELNSSIVSFVAGNNLIGYPYLGERSVEEVFGAIGFQTIYAYDPVLRKWDVYDSSMPSFMNTLTTIKPGMGYWVKTPLASTWTFTNGIIS